MINFNSFIKQSRLTNRRKNHKPISNNKSYFSNPTSENNSKSKDKYLYTNRTNTSKNSMNIIIQNTLSESNNNKFNNNNNNNNFNNNNNYYSVNNMCLFNSKIYEQSIDDLFFYLKNFLNFDVYKNIKKFFIETLIENFKIYNNNNNTIKKLKSSFISEVKNNLFYNSYNTINFNNNNNNLNYKNKNIIENSKENYNSSFYNKNNLKLSYNSTIKHNSLYNLTKNKINSSKSKSNNKTKNNNNTINHKNTKCINKNLFSKINQEIFKIESFRNNKKISLNDLNIVLSTKNKNKSLLNNNNNNNKTINDTINKIKKYTNKNYSNYNNNNNYNNNLKENNIKKKMENKIKNNIIKNVNKKEIKSSDYEIKKNSEQLKEIKSSLDDNLKIMFNFSYEYFLNKESETEKSFDNINLLNN